MYNVLIPFLYGLLNLKLLLNHMSHSIDDDLRLAHVIFELACVLMVDMEPVCEQTGLISYWYFRSAMNFRLHPQ